MGIPTRVTPMAKPWVIRLALYKKTWPNERLDTRKRQSHRFYRYACVGDGLHKPSPSKCLACGIYKVVGIICKTGMTLRKISYLL